MIAKSKIVACALQLVFGLAHGLDGAPTGVELVSTLHMSGKYNNALGRPNLRAKVTNDLMGMFKVRGQEILIAFGCWWWLWHLNFESVGGRW